jgi:hypothetical protein
VSLSAGSVIVNPDATFTGTGLAIGLMNAEIAQYDPRPWYAANDPSGAAPYMQTLAAKSTATATAITAWLAAGGYT